MSKTRITSDDPNVNDFLVVYDLFESRPNKVLLNNMYDEQSFNDILDTQNKIVNQVTDIIPTEDDNVSNIKFLIKLSDTIYLSYIIMESGSEEASVVDCVFYYKSKSDLEQVNTYISKIDDGAFIDIDDDIEHHNLSKDKNKLSYATITEGSTLVVEELDTVDYMDFENINLYYDKETFDSIKKYSKKLKKSKNSLSIIYGERGTGKTNFLRYLHTIIKKDIIFIPSNIIDHTINNLDFLKSLSSKKDALLVIDDCEFIMDSYMNRGNPVVNNILQIVDGIMNSNININIMTIFNTDNTDSIDGNLLDCNNLLDVIEFNYLDPKSSNKLGTHLNSKKTYESDTKLINIIKNRESDDKNVIGFK